MRSYKANFINLGASDHSKKERIGGDYYATDPKALNYLLKYETFNEYVWECACGEGHLSEVLKSYGYIVKSTDKYDRGYGDELVDFLEQTKKFNGDIITNPPYKYSTEFVLKALELTKRKVAMFLKIQFLEGKKRYNEIFKKYPPARVYVFVKRVKVFPNGKNTLKTTAICFAWFVWDKQYTGEPIIRWIYEN